jgi:hypothetical protein
VRGSQRNYTDPGNNLGHVFVSHIRGYSICPSWDLVSSRILALFAQEVLRGQRSEIVCSSAEPRGKFYNSLLGSKLHTWCAC